MSVKDMSKEQLAWLDEVTADKNILFMSLHGSRLYGIDTPTSDFDIKAIYKPTQEDLLLGRANKTYNKKNDELDIEMEVKSLSSFLVSCEKADTVCVDLLNTPDSFVIKNSMLWEDIKRHKETLYSKQMKGMVGYIKVHSHKYTNKIDRMVEVKDLLGNLAEFHNKDIIKDTFIPSLVEEKKYKYIKNVSVVTDHEQEYIEVLGKKFITTWDVSWLRDACTAELKRYGERTAKGADKGLDTKSLSHSLRVLCQLKEIAVTGGLTFPLADAEYILKVKTGKVVYDDVMSDIDSRYEECIDLLENSSLPEKTDTSPLVKSLSRYFFFEGQE